MVLQAKNCPMQPAVPETSEIDLTPLAALVSLLFMWALLDLCQHLELAEEGQSAQGFSLGPYLFCVTPHEHFRDTT